MTVAVAVASIVGTAVISTVIKDVPPATRVQIPVFAPIVQEAGVPEVNVKSATGARNGASPLRIAYTYNCKGEFATLNAKSPPDHSVTFMTYL